MKFIDLMPGGKNTWFGVLKDLKKGKAVLSYSQQGEDLAIGRYFGDKQKGFFVDVGAFQPIKYSNTYAFYKKGWRGINIEPNPDHFDMFRQIRPADINLNIGISEEPGKLQYYMFNEPALNTFEQKHAEEWASHPDFSICEKKIVDTYTLKSVLEKYLPAGQKIDFMSVDVEGFDLKVLKSNDWKKFRPELLLVEESISGTDNFKNSEILPYLSETGYRIWSVSGGTVLFKDHRST
ncbi:MAG: FkbM family methyltransferase [Cytophagaceae bacterium]